jgi:acetylornithine deacetylase
MGAITSPSRVVDPARIERDLVRIVRTRSVTGDEEAVQAVMTELMADAGLAVERLAPDPTATREDPDWPGEEMARSSLPIVIGRAGTPGGRRILVVGHVDVVPVGDETAWTVPPWDGVVRDGDLYGRGACDMKGGVIAILEAFRALRDAGTELPGGEAWFVSVPSEEDGGQGMLAAIRAGATADMAVITEPTGLDIITAHAGAIVFRLTVAGKAAHASKRREGVSALEKLMVLVKALEEDEWERNTGETDPLMTALGLPYPTIIGTISGGEWASTVIDRVTVDGRYGVRLGDTWRDAEATLRRTIERAAAADPWLRDHPPTVEITGGRFSSARTDPNHEVVTSLGDAAESVLGRRPAIAGAPYGADMRLLVNEGATPTIIFGPGDARFAHSADERVPLAEVADCARVLAEWLAHQLASPA